MIESRYWKQDLILFSKYLEKKKHFNYWSEKQQVNFEKRIIIHFFMIRKLIESNKVTKSITNKLYPIRKYKKSYLNLNYLNSSDLEKQFNVDIEINDFKNITFIANQLIHSLVIFGLRKGKKWNSVIMTSDFERKKWLYRIECETISLIMKEIGTNFPKKFNYRYDENKEDYKVIIE